jgi:hypothetical protein
MARPASTTVRKDLTTYAHTISQDVAPAMELANLLAPTVPTGGTTGLYNRFDNTQAFKAYAEVVARRAIGGHAQTIEFLGDTANFNAKAYGLRINIDQQERDNAGGAVNLLEQGKTRTLMINCVISHLAYIVGLIKASISATANLGVWTDPNVDPIAQINAQIKAVWLATGVIPNNVVFDFGGWCIFSQHPKVLARMPGADVAYVTPARIQGLLVNPNAKITIAETAILSGGGLGNAAAGRQGILGGSVLVFFSSPMATQYDPSFMKCFSPSASLFTEVYSYEEQPHFTWFENDWTCHPAVVASSLCKRIDVTGANT